MSDAKKEEKKEGEEGAAPPAKSKKKLIFIVVGLLVLVGVGGFVMLGGKKEEKKDEHAEEVEPEKVFETATLDTFIVNLSENATFLKATILVEYDPSIINAHASPAGGEAEGGGHSGGGEEAKGNKLPDLFVKRKPMVYDSIIRVMSAKKASEVITIEGKEQLKQELIEAINEALGMDEAPVVNIYFTEFIIQ